MKNQSFWRGFGVGILFASLILGISCMIRTSDSQVVSRAKKLGMVYKTQEEMVTAKLDNQDGAEASPASSPDASEDAGKKTKAPAKTEKPKQTESVTPPSPEVDDAGKDSSPKDNDSSEKTSSKKDTSLADAKKNMENEKKDMQETIQKQSKTLEIKVGDWSSTVSSKLESLGIIKSATDFDKYLNDHGYSASISAGTYKVSPGESYRDLARKITGK